MAQIYIINSLYPQINANTYITSINNTTIIKSKKFMVKNPWVISILITSYSPSLIHSKYYQPYQHPRCPLIGSHIPQY